MGRTYERMRSMQGATQSHIQQQPPVRPQHILESKQRARHTQGDLIPQGHKPPCPIPPTVTHLVSPRVQPPARPVWTQRRQWHARVCRPQALPVWRQRGGRGPAWRLLLLRLLPGGWVSRPPASVAGCLSSPDL